MAGNFQNRLRGRFDNGAVLRSVFLSTQRRKRARKKVLLSGGRVDRKTENGGENRKNLCRYSYGAESSYIVLDAHDFIVAHGLYFYKRLIALSNR